MAKDLGTQSDRTMNKQVAPQPAPCDGRQFAHNPHNFQTDEYWDTHADKYGNWVADDNSTWMSENATGRQGKYGTTGFADYESADGLGFQGVNFYGPEDVNGDKSSTVIVDVGRADRGKET